jgi:CHAD domain-containing protein
MLHGYEKGDMQAVHRTRVASRRLRAVLPVLEIDASAARKLGRRLRKVTSRLGALRELDVLGILVDELRESGRSDVPALRLLAGSIAEDRARAYGRLESKLPVSELRRIAEKLDKIARKSASDTGRAWSWALDARTVRRADDLAEAIRKAGGVYMPDRVHAVRLAVKKLRYTLELSAEAAGLKQTADLRAVRREQDLLGRLHDLQVLIDRVRHVQATLTRADLRMWRELDNVKSNLEDACRRLHARFVHDQPGLLAICERVGAKLAHDGTSAARAS